jgi:predicted DNA-binding transcriptional regulator YafY
MMFVSGSVLSCSYPSDNRVGAITRLETRRIVLRYERDLRQSPLDPVTLRLRPKVRRGQLLIVGYDLDRRAMRRFYVDSMRGLRVSDQPLMRLGIYSALGDDEPRLFGQPLTDCRADQEHARRVIESLNRWLYERGTGQVAGLFPLMAKARAA